jgi:Fur family peroxide stress response transcriptional regulator
LTFYKETFYNINDNDYYFGGIDMAEQTTLKRSRQREAIVAFLKTRKDHPTADTVYQEIRNTIPNISLGTVYRNLALLAQRGEILRLACDGKVDRFDADTSPHYHFMCLNCGCVKDIDMPYASNIDEEANEEFDGMITSHSILFQGYCRDCKKSQGF